MKKKMYNQPQIQTEELMPTTIICASITAGEPVPDPGSGGTPMFGD
jgi:hypothetical protein